MIQFKNIGYLALHFLKEFSFKIIETRFLLVTKEATLEKDIEVRYNVKILLMNRLWVIHLLVLGVTERYTMWLNLKISDI